jgi:pimeloyl-ACP methyl ester carboxylesterase
MLNQNPILFSNIILPISADRNLLILHGFLGMSDNWKTLGNQYASENFNVHLIDLRNHGHSFHLDSFNYEVMVEDVYQYCLSNQLEKINLIGHSMGGKVAMFFAMKYPEMIDKLIVADIGPKHYAPHHQQILTGLNAVDFSTKPNRNQVDLILQNYISDFGTRQFLLKNLYWQTPDQLAFRFNLAVFNTSINEIGKALPSDLKYSKPTLFIRGGSSDYILDTDFEAIRLQFPLAEFQTIEKVGHWLHAENPKNFFEKTIQFLIQ